MKSINNLVKCREIKVDCVPNNPVDIRRGEPEYLGFDFWVADDQVSEILKFIAISLCALGVPVINLYAADTRILHQREVWSKQDIMRSIKREADYLKLEGSKGRTLKKS